jgi:hypothetical protein
MISASYQRRFSMLALVCIASVGSVPLAHAAAAAFRASFLSIETGRSPSSVAAADLDGSGKLDLVVANRFSNTITVLKGFPGSPARSSYPVGAEPTAVALADVTGDQRLDAVVACVAAHSVTVLRGAGSGFELPGATYAAGSQPSSIAVVDFDADGRADIAVTNYEYSGTVSILLASGSSFEPPVAYATARYPRSLAVEDFDRDGDADLVATSYGPPAVGDPFLGTYVTLLAGNGDGTFAPGVDYSVGLQPIGIAVGDVDGDSDIDIVTVSEFDPSVSVLRNFGNGTFAPAQNLALDPYGRPAAVALAHIDAGPHVDVVVADWVYSRVTFLAGRGDGTFGPALNSPTGFDPKSIVSVDFSGDGRRDLAVACAASNAVALMTGNGNGSFGRALATGPFHAPRHVVAADLDGDAVQDMVVAGGSQNYNTGLVWVLRGSGDGRFAPPASYGPAGTLPVSVSLGDFDRDGRTDIGTSDYGNGSPNTNCFLKNIGGGQFRIESLLPGVSFGWSSGAGDLTGDGFVDLAVSTTLGDAVHIYAGSAVGLASPAIDVPAADDAHGLCLGDFNGDTRLDIALAHGGPRLLAILLSTGNGAFTREEIPMEANAFRVACGDFDRDTRIDLAVLLNRWDGMGIVDEIAIMHGLGDGRFTRGATVGTGQTAWQVSASDINGDGILDLLTANATNTVSLLIGQGDGTFPERVDYGAGNGPNAVAVADVNGDARPDLLVANMGGNDVSVLLNETPLATDAAAPGFGTNFLALGSNPARGAARIEYGLARGGGASLEVTDVRGRHVRVLATGLHVTGRRSLTWDGRDDSGQRVPPGVYFVTLHASGSEQSRKLVLMRR